MRSLLKHWGPVIAWAGLIFFFSTSEFTASNTSLIIGPILHWINPNISQEGESAIHFVVRKLGHWSEYFIFALLLVWALDRTSPRRWNFRNTYYWAGLVILLYACSDEFHQSFVPGRTASWHDSLLDFFGGICALGWLSWRRRRAVRNETVECG